MVILDTDTLTLIGYGRVAVMRRLEELRRTEPERMIAISVVTWFETVRGRGQSILKAANEQGLRTAMHRFALTQRFLADYPVIDIDDVAAEHFEQLRTQKKLKIQTADLLIACVALSQKALLVTRNLKDYRHLPGLQLANWDQ